MNPNMKVSGGIHHYLAGKVYVKLDLVMICYVMVRLGEFRLGSVI